MRKLNIKSTIILLLVLAVYSDDVSAQEQKLVKDVHILREGGTLPEYPTGEMYGSMSTIMYASLQK